MYSMMLCAVLAMAIAVEGVTCWRHAHTYLLSGIDTMARTLLVVKTYPNEFLMLRSFFERMKDWGSFNCWYREDMLDTEDMVTLSRKWFP